MSHNTQQGSYYELFSDNGQKFADPFLLQSSKTFPLTMETAPDMCLFLYYMNPQYRRANLRMIAHFITRLQFDGEDGDQKERDELRDYLMDQLDLFGALHALGEEWACFDGATKVPTADGVFEIRDLVGKTKQVLSKDGVYRDALFKSFGMQELMEVELSDKRVILATPEHQWVVRSGANEIRVTTEQLCSSHSIERTVAPRPPKNEDYRAGVRHGFIFGDGSLSGKGNNTTALFCGEKDEAILPFFEGHGNDPIPRDDTPYKCVRVSGLEGNLKDLPARDASPSYWYGFVSGFLAADGSCDTYGCALLTQATKSTLEAIIEQLPRIGMCAGPLRSQVRDTSIGGRDYFDHEMYIVTLLKRFMQADDFLIPAHRKNFEKNFNQHSEYGRYIGVKEVRRTGIWREVFCCEEMETHSFVIENGTLTGNCYGNGYLRINFPFDRFLIDRRSGKSKFYALDMFKDKAKYQYMTMQYRVPDPTCMRPDGTSEREIDLPFMDRPSMDMSRVTLRKLDPRYVDLMHSWISGRTRVVYRFEEFFIDAIKKGYLWQVNETPMGMLKAIRDNEDFLFHEDEIFHYKAPTLTGISNNGMGLPETIANFRSLYNVQVYRKIDESVGLDYMLPFRIFTPELGANPSMAEMADMGQWTEFMGEVIQSRRRDPFAMHAIPIPTRYQEAGGNGKTVTPFENIQFADKQLQEATGIPAELWQGTLRVESIPTTLRLFENTFHFILRNNTALTKWVVRRLLSHQNREQIGVSMQLPSMADDLEERNVYLQLAAGGEITRSKAYRAFGVDDPVQEAKARMQEDIEIQKAQTKIQAEFQREQQLGSVNQIIEAQSQQQTGAGSAIPAPGQQAPSTPLDILSQAEETAKQWLAIQSDGERTKAMKQVEASNPNLYYAAKGKMEEFRRQGASQGRAQVGQMAQQAMQAGPAQ